MYTNTHIPECTCTSNTFNRCTNGFRADYRTFHFLSLSLYFDLVYDAFVCKAKLIWFALLRFSLFYFKICVMRVHHRSAFIGKSGSLCFNIDKSYLINCKLLDATLFFSVECCLFAHYQSRTNLFVVILKFICFEICMRVKRVCVICLSVRL